MAAAQLWSGKYTFPSLQQMEFSIDKQHEVNAAHWSKNPSAERGVSMMMATSGDWSCVHKSETLNNTQRPRSGGAPHLRCFIRFCSK